MMMLMMMMMMMMMMMAKGLGEEGNDDTYPRAYAHLAKCYSFHVPRPPFGAQTTSDLTRFLHLDDQETLVEHGKGTDFNNELSTSCHVDDMFP